MVLLQSYPWENHSLILLWLLLLMQSCGKQCRLAQPHCQAATQNKNYLTANYNLPLHKKHWDQHNSQHKQYFRIHFTIFHTADYFYKAAELQTLQCQVPTNIVLDVADVEGGGRHSQAQPILLGDQDGLCKALLFQILRCQLAAWHFHHYVFSTAKAKTDSVVRSSMLSLECSAFHCWKEDTVKNEL